MLLFEKKEKEQNDIPTGKEKSSAQKQIKTVIYDFKMS